MYFNYTDSFYVEESDLEEMYRLCKEEHYSVEDAVDEVALGFDDEFFYTYANVEDQIIKEIERRLAQNNN